MNKVLHFFRFPCAVAIFDVTDDATRLSKALRPARYKRSAGRATRPTYALGALSSLHPPLLHPEGEGEDMAVRRLTPLAVAVALVALASLAAEARATVGAVADSADGGQMTDALRYLEELDKYYSQVARPR